MGIMNDVNASEQTKAEGPPWYMESGVYPGGLARVEVGTSKAGPLNVYTLHLSPECKPPSSDDVPRLSIALDMNEPKHVKVLYGLIGKPMRDGNAVKWDGSGLFQWNGVTGEKSTTSGRAEFTIETKPPEPKRDGKGYWYARYEVKDVSRVGEAQEMADKSANALIDAMEKQPEEKTGPTPPPAQPVKRR